MAGEETFRLNMGGLGNKRDEMKLGNHRDQHEVDADLMIEAILREIARAKRFLTITEARFAMLNVRRIEKEITDEMNYHRSPQEQAIKGSFNDQ